MARLSPSDLKREVQTVPGLIGPSELGSTLMHEHLLWDIRTPKMQADPNQGLEIDLCNCWHVNYGLCGKVPLNLVFFDREIATKEVAERLRWMRRLIDRGHLDQIAISHDICYKSRLSSYGGHGYAHIFENVELLMRRRGFSEAEIERITVEMPRRLLTFV